MQKANSKLTSSLDHSAIPTSPSSLDIKKREHISELEHKQGQNEPGDQLINSPNGSSCDINSLYGKRTKL